MEDAALQVTETGVESHLVQPGLYTSGAIALPTSPHHCDCSLQQVTCGAGTFTMGTAVKRQCTEE